MDRYFINEAKRLVRTHDGDVTAEGWREVSLSEWEAFRKETRTISPAKLKKMRAG